MTGRPYDVNIPIRNICHMEMTIILLDYNFSCLILFLDLHFGEKNLKIKIGLLFFIFFIKKSPIIFILFYKTFNFPSDLGQEYNQEQVKKNNFT